MFTVVNISIIVDFSLVLRSHPADHDAALLCYLCRPYETLDLLLRANNNPSTTAAHLARATLVGYSANIALFASSLLTPLPPPLVDYAEPLPP